MNTKRFAMTGMLLALMLSAHAQQEGQATTEETDSIVRIIGWFCTGDTLEYSFSSVVAEVAGNDTTTLESAYNEFHICVTDSTKKGYTMEYTPTATEASDSTSARGRMMLMAARLALGNKVVFTTDEYGVFQEIRNWKEVYSNALAVDQKLVDQMYKDSPALYAQMSKPDMMKKMKELVQEKMGSREKITEQFHALKFLFSFHGKAFPLGEFDVEKDGSKLHYDITQGKLEDEENSTDDEYQLYCEVEFPETDGVKTTIHYSYCYFADGWPRSVLITTVEERADKTLITQFDIDWMSKSWR